MNGKPLDGYTRGCLLAVAALYALLWLAANVIRKLVS